MYNITEEQKKVIEKGLLTAIDNGTDDEFTSQEMHLINDAFELVNNLTIPVVVERYLFEGRDLTNNQPFKKVIDAENRESAIADMEVTYPHLKWVMTTKV
jgi:hypothetical protein